MVECIIEKHQIIQVTLSSQNILNNAEMGMWPQITFTSLAKIIRNFKCAQNRPPNSRNRELSLGKAFPSSSRTFPMLLWLRKYKLNAKNKIIYSFKTPLPQLSYDLSPIKSKASHHCQAASRDARVWSWSMSFLPVITTQICNWL